MAKKEVEEDVKVDFTSGHCFNGLLRVVEHHLPEFREVLQRARLFVIPKRGHELLEDRSIFQMGNEFFNAHYRLPYPWVAVEDTASCVVLLDETPGAVGFGARRRFIECQCTDPNRLPEFRHGATECSPGVPRNIFLVYHGWVENLHYRGEPGEEVCGTFDVDGVLAVQGKEVVPFGVPKSDLAPKIFGNVHIAMTEIAYINRPDRLCVEVWPKNAREGRNGKQPVKIPRSHERPRYLMLDPTVVHKVMNGDSENGGGEKHTRAFLGRLGHSRTYRHERYKNVRGKTVWIPPVTWNGPVENEFRGHRYRVCLDATRIGT